MEAGVEGGGGDKNDLNLIQGQSIYNQDLSILLHKAEYEILLFDTAATEGVHLWH